MEQVESIPFSSLIAAMLLKKKSYTSLEIATEICKLERMGIVIDDENDNLEIISCCVEMDFDCSFHLRRGLNYDSVLSTGVKVSTFLRLYTNDHVLSILDNNIDDSVPQENFVYSNGEVKNKKRKGIFGFKHDTKRKVLIKVKQSYRDISLKREKSEFGRAILG